MNFHKLVIFLLLVLVFSRETTAGVYFRYNRLGYNPARNKRIIVMSDESITGKKWSFTTVSGGDEVLGGKFPKSLYGKGAHTPKDYNYVIDFSTLKDTGSYIFSVDKSLSKDTAMIVIKKHPYDWILEAPLRWMRVTRCGSHEALDHGFCHAGDTACTVLRRVGIHNNQWVPDESSPKVNGFGGWHDAGDYLKFTLTIAYADYFILKAYEVNPDIFKKKYSKTDLVDVLDEGKWGLEYLDKTMTYEDTNTFIIGVGDDEDHNIGFRLPENDELDGKRPAFVAMSPTQMGYTAAALALGSRIFKGIGKTEDADRYLKKAELIFRRAVSKDVVAPAWLDAEYPFYDDDTKYDNLELAAAELFETTKDTTYLKYAEKFSDKARAAGWRAWESVNMPAHLVLMKHYSVVKNDLRIDLDDFLKNSRRQGNIWGLPIKYVWGGLYCYIGIASAAMEYQLKTGSRKYESMARNMIDYMFGTNNWGICFVATPKVDYTIKHPFSQIYSLQADKFPIGAISEGPGDFRSWNEDKPWFGYDYHAEPTYQFNTDKGVFYDNSKDYMCMETTIGGVADGIFMLALAAKLYND